MPDECTTRHTYGTLNDGTTYDEHETDFSKREVGLETVDASAEAEPTVLFSANEPKLIIR